MGIMVTCDGIIMVAKTIINKNLCPRKRNFAKAYPAIELNRTLSMEYRVTISVFTRYLLKFISAKSSLKLSSVGFSGKNVGIVLPISRLVLKEERIIQKNGKHTRHPITRRAAIKIP